MTGLSKESGENRLAGVFAVWLASLDSLVTEKMNIREDGAVPFVTQICARSVVGVIPGMARLLLGPWSL